MGILCCVSNRCSYYNIMKQNGVIIFWIVLFLLVVGFRVALGPLGEVICTSLLITITIHVYLWSAHGCDGLCFSCCYTTDRRHPAPSLSSSSNDDVASESVHNTNDDDDDDNDDNEVTPISSSSSTFVSRRGNETPATTTTTTTTTTRLPYLDNVKIFLTALVVTHHVSCAFGACGERSWYLIVGFDGPLWFEVFLNTLTLLDQSFFMPLFFFISAYFVPTTYAKKGGWKGLQASKRKRILIPAIFVTFFVSPAAIIVSNWIQKFEYDNSTSTDSDNDTTAAGKTVFYYYPSPGPAWFLYWLLLFNLVYVSVIRASEYELITNNDDTPEYTQPETLVVEETPISSMSCPTTGRSDRDSPASNNMPEQSCEEAQITNPEEEEEEEENPSIILPPLKPFPSTSLRMCCGIFICGLLLLPFLIILDDPHTFAAMPVSVGSLTCDFFMFYMGIEAKKNRWLENSLLGQLDIHPIVFTCIVILEGTALTILLHLLMDEQNLYSAGIPLVLISGMFCLDVGLLILMVFQRWMNVETKFTRFLARGAFGVYLIHALVVTCISALYVHTYNNLRPDDPIDLTRGEGGGSYYPLGWLIVNLASHLVSWPLAYFLAQLPYLKTILQLEVADLK